MTETATVVKTEGRYAVVRLEKKAECDKCGLCVFGKNAAFTEMRAANDAGAVEGDEVIVQRSRDGRFLGAILVFLIPLILIGLASVISVLWVKKDIWILILSLIFLFLWYTILAVIDKKLQRLSSFEPKIVAILKKGGIEDDKGNNGQDGV